MVMLTLLVVVELKISCFFVFVFFCGGLEHIPLVSTVLDFFFFSLVGSQKFNRFAGLVKDKRFFLFLSVFFFFFFLWVFCGGFRTGGTGMERICLLILNSKCIWNVDF